MDPKLEIKKEEEARKEAKVSWQEYMDRVLPRTCKKHEFEYRGRGNEIRCKCGVGYYLPLTGTLKNGSVYIDGKLVL